MRLNTQPCIVLKWFEAAPVNPVCPICEKHEYTFTEPRYEPALEGAEAPICRECAVEHVPQLILAQKKANEAWRDLACECEPAF